MLKNINQIKSIVLLLIISFFVSISWEMAHSFLYNWNMHPLKNDFWFYLFRILKSTIGDVFVISIIFIINSLINKNIYWYKEISKKDILISIFIGLIFAIFFEIRAYYLNYWHYSKYMPTIFGIGITPLIQLSITSVITFFTLKMISKNK